MRDPEIVHQRQLDLSIIPAGTQLSAHDPDVPVRDALQDRQAMRPGYITM